MAGIYEWPFELELQGSTTETVEGLADSYIQYMLKGTITRGHLESSIYTFKPVRIIRQLDITALGLSGPVTVAETWSGKIQYQFSIPQRAIAFGTSITMHMSFKPLLRGLRIGLVRCVLLELQEFEVPAAVVAKGMKRVKIVASWNLEMPDRRRQQDMLVGEERDGCTLDAVFPLPQRLNKCVQDTDVCGIKIRHEMQVSLDLHNPDGHTSEVSPP